MRYLPNNLMKECIEKNDMKGLRRALGTVIYMDRDFSNGEFDSAINYIINECNINTLTEDFDVSTPLVCDGKSNFTDDDFADAIFELQNNFCVERINDVKKIGINLYGKKHVDNDVDLLSVSKSLNSDRDEVIKPKKSQCHKTSGAKNKNINYTKVALIGATIVIAGVVIITLGKIIE